MLGLAMQRREVSRRTTERGPRLDARAWMLEAWFGLRGPDESANQWIRKAGAEHYGEHLSRLRDWVAELVDLRNRPVVDEWEG